MSDSSSSKQNFEYASEKELITEFKTLMSDPENLETAANYLYDSLIDETVLGIIFEMHYAAKTGTAKAIEGEPEKNDQYRIGDVPEIDMLGAYNMKKQLAQNCNCPNCERLVAATKFAPHLEKCMGLRRNSSRIASRRIATREGGNYFSSTLSDDEDYGEWSSDKRKKRSATAVRTNGSKKNGKSS